MGRSTKCILSGDPLLRHTRSVAPDKICCYHQRLALCFDSPCGTSGGFQCTWSTDPQNPLTPSQVSDDSQHVFSRTPELEMRGPHCVLGVSSFLLGQSAIMYLARNTVTVLTRPSRSSLDASGCCEMYQNFLLFSREARRPLMRRNVPLHASAAC